MKKNVLLFFLFFALSSLTLVGQTFVDASASGSDDGSSWDNAYTNLETALENTTTGEMWVAAGTYKPEGSVKTSSFVVKGGIQLYGGFAGTESAISERDIAANPTILSGDIAGDDVDFDFLVAKEDNVYHVVVVDSLLSDVAFDGFTVRGGQTREIAEETDGTAIDEFFWAGGGIFSYSTIDVDNCFFDNNFARRGACIAVTNSAGGGNGSNFNKNIFTKSQSNSQSAGIFLNTLENIVVEDCNFTNNSTTRGALYPLRCNSVSVLNCVFEDNVNPGGFGGAFFAWNNDNLLLDNCIFNFNSAGNGGVMYVDGREFETATDNVQMKNCTFEGNRATTGAGGAVNTWELSYTLENCTFTDNRATASVGGAVHNGGGTSTREINIRDNIFEDNEANFGGALTCYSDLGTFNVENNDFMSNAAYTSGGASIHAFGSTTNFINNDFERDSARFGGAIACQNNPTTINISKCHFDENEANDNAGCINIIDGLTMNLSTSSFNLNSALGFGGVMNIQHNDDTIFGTVLIDRCKFYNNTADVQAGGLNIGNFDVTVQNSVLAFNNNFGTGAGGAISVNGFGGFISKTTLLNTTIAENFAPLGSGIAAFQDGDDASVIELVMQNNILSNPEGENYEVEAGDILVTSFGGNLSTDNSTDGLLVATNDISDGDDPMFIESDELNFGLLDGSPAIDIGIAAGATTYDLLGATRDAMPDAGAVEFGTIDQIAETFLDNTKLLVIKTNPVGSDLTYSLETNWTGNITSFIVDMKGQKISTQEIVKQDQSQQFTQNVADLNPGVYFLVVKQNNQAIIAKLIKM